MYKYVLNLAIKLSLMFAQYFEYYAIILRGAVFLWTQCIWKRWCAIFRSEFSFFVIKHSESATEYGRVNSVE